MSFISTKCVCGVRDNQLGECRPCDQPVAEFCPEKQHCNRHCRIFHLPIGSNLLSEFYGSDHDQRGDKKEEHEKRRLFLKQLITMFRKEWPIEKVEEKKDVERDEKIEERVEESEDKNKNESIDILCQSCSEKIKNCSSCGTKIIKI